MRARLCVVLVSLFFAVGASAAGNHRLVYSNHGALAIWKESRNHFATEAVYGRILDRNLKPAAAYDFPITEQIDSLSWFLREPDALHAASDGVSYLVGYTRRPDAPGPETTRFVSVAADGTVGRGGAVLDGRITSLVWTEGTYVATLWQGLAVSLVTLDDNGTVTASVVHHYRSHGVLKLSSLPGGRLLLQLIDDSDGLFVVTTLAEIRHNFEEVLSRGHQYDDRYFEPVFAASEDRLLTVQDDDIFAGTFVLTTWKYDGTRVAQTRVQDPRMTGWALTALPLGDGWAILTSGPAQDDCILLRVDRDLTLAGPAQVLPGGWTTEAALVPTTDGGAALLWTPVPECCIYKYPTVLQRVSSTGQFLYENGIVMNRPARTQASAVARQCGDHYATAWIDQWNDHSAIQFRRYRKEETAVDPIDFTLEPETKDIVSSDLTLTCGRNSFLVTYLRASGPYVDQQDRVLVFFPFEGPETKRVMRRRGWAGAATFDGDDYVVLELHKYSPPTLMRWSEEGTLLGTEDVRGLGIFNPDVALTSIGTTLYLGWHEGQWEQKYHLSRFNRSFQQIPGEIALDTRSIGWSAFPAFALAGGPEGVLAVWARDLGGGRAIPMTARLTPDLVFLDPASGVVAGTPRRVESESGGKTMPLDVAWTGNSFELATRDGLQTVPFAGVPSPIAVAIPEDSSLVAITNSGSRRLVVYEQLDPTGNVKQLHSMFTSIDPWAPPSRRRSVAH